MARRKRPGPRPRASRPESNRPVQPVAIDGQIHPAKLDDPIEFEKFDRFILNCRRTIWVFAACFSIWLPFKDELQFSKLLAILKPTVLKYWSLLYPPLSNTLFVLEEQFQKLSSLLYLQLSSALTLLNDQFQKSLSLLCSQFSHILVIPKIQLQNFWPYIRSRMNLSKDVTGGVTNFLPSFRTTTLAAPSNNTMIRDIGLLLSVAWLLYRGWQVLQQPVEQLEDKLGIDRPPVPVVSISTIEHDSVQLYWLNEQESQSNPLKMSLYANGIKIGEFDQGQTSILLTGLRPGRYYIIHVCATNATNNTTVGPEISIRTVPLEPGQDQSQYENIAATIQTAAIGPAFSTPLPVTNEISGSQNHPRRTVSGRLESINLLLANQTAEESAQTGEEDEDESPETIQRLIERVEFCKKRNADFEKQIEEEELESQNYLANLATERDRLKQQLKEKEEANAELRRRGHQLDKINRAAQSKKANKEKQLQQKKAERQKIKDDMARWDREITEMKKETEEMRKETSRVYAEKDEFVAEKRKLFAEDQREIKILEEEIRVKSAQIKALESERESASGNGNEERERTREDREREEMWELRHQATQAQLAAAFQAVQQVQLEEQQAKHTLEYWLEKRARNPEQFAPIPLTDFPPAVHRNKSRRSRQNNSRASNASSSGYQGAGMPFGSTSTISPPFPSTSPFFNIGNRTAFPPMSEHTAFPQPETEMHAGPGLMSAVVNELLPSNLLRDDDANNQRFSSAIRDPFGNINSDPFSKHALSNSDASAHGPHTPISTRSRAGSIFSSPHESMHNLHGMSSRSDHFGESDQRPIDSSSAKFPTANSNPMASNKIASLFSSPFLRPRGSGKSDAQDPPLLGTLKQGQSQSFPRNLEDTPEVGRRRSGSYGNWGNPVAGLLGSAGGNLITARTGSGRRSRLNMFGLKADALDSSAFADRSVPSRPSSTYSYDQALARPSSESQRLSFSIAEGIPSRNSPLGSHWASSSGPWSRNPSRRPSVQHGSTSNLSVGSTPLGPEEFPSTFSKQRSEQLPIGTRPQSSQRPVTPKLNPTAPSFKTLFSWEARKAVKSDKTVGKSMKFKDGERMEEDSEYVKESPPQNPRISRDAQSVTTATSAADSRESFDRSTSGTPSETITPSGPKEPKESLMQKITRKSSSSKFNVPWSKDKGMFSKRAGEPSTPDEISENTSSEGLLGRSVDSAGSTPQQEKSSRASISWPTMRRKPKKGEQSAKSSTEEPAEEFDFDELLDQLAEED